MSSFDIDAFYAEQDERMNVPDETPDEILKRVSSLRRGQGVNAYGSSRMSPVNNSIETDHAQPGTPLHKAMIASPPAAGAAHHDVFPGSSENIRDPAMDSGRSLKRKASIHDSTVEVAVKRPKSADLNNYQKNREDSPQFDLPTDTPSTPIRRSEPERKATSSPEIEEIDSFTVDIDPADVLSKQKTPFRRAKQTSHKQKAAPRASPMPITADHSPISSFSRVVTDLSGPVKPRKDNAAPVLKQPPLDLRPISGAPPTRLLSKDSRNKRKGADPAEVDQHDSPIEDAAPPNKKKRLESEPSELFLEIKQRIAKHSNMSKEKPDKLKVKANPTSRHPNNTISTMQPADESSVIYISSSPSSRASSPGPIGSGTTKKRIGVKEKSVKAVAAKRIPKGKKEKPQPVTPSQYAKLIQTNPGDLPEGSTAGPVGPRRPKAKFPYLAGKNIFYTGGDMNYASEGTRGRMDIIVQYGGNLMPEYDPEVTTHIVTETTKASLLRIIGLKSLSQIPDHIPTVKWTWVVRAMSLRRNLSQDDVDRALGEPFMHAAYPERINAGCTVLPKSVPSFRFKQRAKAIEESPVGSPELDVSSSSGTGQSNPPGTVLDNQHGPSTPPGAPLSPPTSPVRLTVPSKTRASTNVEVGAPPGGGSDPLAEFYPQAKLEQKTEDRWKHPGFGSGESGESESESDDLPIPSPRGKKGFACDTKEAQLDNCPNEDIINKLNELMKLHEAKPGTEDHWRAFSYKKSIRALKNYPRRIKSGEEARNIRGVGEKTAQKIEEILQTGELRRIKYENSEDVIVTRLFQGIYGVGQKTALQWYLAGCRTLDDLRNGKGGVKLSPVQQIGLQYYDDINDRMPREEAKHIFDLIAPIAFSIDPKLSFQIMGSYRRGKQNCGDIDILMTRPIDDGKTHSGVLPKLLKRLHDADILTHDLALSDGYKEDVEATYRGLCHFPHRTTSRMRRIDILCVAWESRGAALIYYTGDEIFNRAIRLKAQSLGYALNQRGLFRNVVRNPTWPYEKLNPGVLVASDTEEEIFKTLGVPWQEPHERVRGFD